MVKGITPTGFAYSIDDDARDDMEMLEGFTAISKGDLSVLPETIEKLLGKKQKDKLYDFCRSKKGRVSARRVIEEVRAILEDAGKESENLKN